MSNNERQIVSGIRNSLDPTVKTQLDQLNYKVEPLLARTTNVLTNFTEHTLKHSLGVEKTYDILLDGNYELLTQKERYILIASTLLHDIGMMGRKEDLSKEDYENDRRKGHQTFSKEIIKEHAIQFGFSGNEASVISDVAEAHRKVPLEALEESIPFGLGESVRPRLLAALLRFGDELHITEDRTSQLVIDVLKPDEESLKHHLRHLAVTGVDRKFNDRQKIQISARIENWDMERLLNDMVNEIRTKYNQVREILNAADILVSEIVTQYNDQYLLEKEIILLLSHQQLTLDDIWGNLSNRNQNAIRSKIISLTETKILFVDSEGCYSLGRDKTVFTAAFNALKGTERLYDFIKSGYVRNNIGVIFDDIAITNYSTRFFNGDRQDRLLLIGNSPTVLDNLLNQQEANPKFGNMNRSVVLDLLILNGYMQDVSLNPLLSKEEEVVFAMQNIQESLNKEMGSFLQLVQHLDPKSIEEGKREVEQDSKKKQH
ncbi:HD domain-containing protein [Priestia megaterium]|uniref:HD domain-containing protein n=1 Tax=Priestia megaterium TaxID=1404 RepID=UPI00366B6CC5